MGLMTLRDRGTVKEPCAAAWWMETASKASMSQAQAQAVEDCGTVMSSADVVVVAGLQQVTGQNFRSPPGPAGRGPADNIERDQQAYQVDR